MPGFIPDEKLEDHFTLSDAYIMSSRRDFFFQAEDGIRDLYVTGVQTCALPILKRLLVICPSFVSDCLETLEEIQMRGRDAFLAAGGSDLTLIPCLNEHPLWIDTLQKIGRAHV